MPSIAVVVLDTLRYDAFQRAFGWLPGRHFTRAYSTSHWTVPVHASLFTGRYASEVGVHGGAPDLDCDDETLAEALASGGYRTRCFTANPQMVQYDGWERGFDEFAGYYSLTSYREDSFDWGRAFQSIDATGYRRHLDAIRQCVTSDCATLRSLREGAELFGRSDADGGVTSVLERVRATDVGDDEFCFVNCMDAHTPYYPPPGEDEPVIVVAADAFSEEPLDLDRVRAAYRASVDHLEAVYRELYAELTERFDYVVTCSDHGELLGEHGLVNHSFGLYPELVHVPLVVDGPDVEQGVDDAVVSLLDVHRTVADLAGIDVDSRGQQLLGDREPRDVLFEYHGLLPFHEAQFDRTGVPAEVYERRREPIAGFVAPDGTYVHETHTDGLRVGGEGVDDPAARLDRLTASLDRRETAASERDVSSDVRDRLEDLGYA